MALELVDRQAFEPYVSFDGGDLDCGNGLLLLIRQHIESMTRGQLLEARSIEIDCGFATFADNPVASAAVAEGQLKAIVDAAALVRRG